MKQFIKNTFFIFLFFLILGSIVSADNYNVSFVQIDRFICKNTSEFSHNYEGIIDNHQLNQKTSKIFDKQFRESVIYWEEFNLTRGWNQTENRPNKVFYFLSQNNSQYRVETDGDWYFIKVNLAELIDPNQFDKEYNCFRHYQRFIKYLLRESISEATGLNCIAGSDSYHGIMDLFIVQNYPMKNLSCHNELGSIFIDCLNDPTISQTLNTVWINISYHDRRSYISGINMIFLDLDEFKFNDRDDFDYMQKPMIVFSESKFANTLESGQSVFIKHIEYLQVLENLPIAIARLESEIVGITNFTNEVYDVLGDITENSHLSKDEEVQKLILNNPFDYKTVEYYINQLKLFQDIFNNALILKNDNPRLYFEDAYYTIANKYITELNSKLIIFKDKLDILRDLQGHYNSYTTDVSTEINTKDITLKNSLYLLITLLVTILLFVTKENVTKYGYSNQGFFYLPIILLLALFGIPFFDFSKLLCLVFVFFIADFYLIYFWFYGDIFLFYSTKVIFLFPFKIKIIHWMLFNMETLKKNRLLKQYHKYSKLLKEEVRKDVNNFKKAHQDKNLDNYEKYRNYLNEYRFPLETIHQWDIDKRDTEEYIKFLKDIELLLEELNFENKPISEQTFEGGDIKNVGFQKD